MATVLLVLTEPQARVVNAALALYEAEVETDEDGLHDTRPDVLARTRLKVWDAMDEEGVEV